AAEPAVAEAVDRVIAAALRERAFAGAAVGVSVNGRVVLTRGYGLADLEQRVPVTGQTVFRIGSGTQPISAPALPPLGDQGKLSLDDPLAKFQPDFPRASEVTIRQLLSHTSGISSYTNPKVVQGDPREGARRDWTTDAMIGHIASLKPPYEFDPGTGW